MRFLKLLIFVLLIAGAVAGSLWWFKKPPEVQTVMPTTGRAAEVVYATAVVEPVRWAKVYQHHPRADRLAVRLRG